MMIDFSTVSEFENEVANFFGSPYGVAVDSCTHGLELCLRFFQSEEINVPKRTYLSVPFLAEKLKINLNWTDERWEEYYYLTDNIIDAAILWREGSYIPNTFMSLSFQYQKHLSLGRGGMILTDNEDVARHLRKMVYDGRIPNIPWREQNIQTIGYHYYMTPETADLGLRKLPKAIETPPRGWAIEDWPDLTENEIFK